MDTQVPNPQNGPTDEDIKRNHILDPIDFQQNAKIGQRKIYRIDVKNRLLDPNAISISVLSPNLYSSSNTPLTLVYRNASGNFSAGTITATLAGTATGNENPLTFTSPIIRTSNAISINATSANTVNYVVQRDASGNFSAGTITATLTGAASLNLLKSGDTMAGNLTLSAVNIITDTTTGTKIGTSTSQKISVWNATPIVQPTTGVAAATFVANTSGIVNDTATFDSYTIGQVVKALRNIGLLA